MSNYIHYRSLTPNHISRSVIISPSNERPIFMRTALLNGIPWPTPATRAYESVVSLSFSRFYWNQDPPERKILLKSVSQELFHEGGGRIYTRFNENNEVLVKQTVSEFISIIKTRLVNLRKIRSEVANLRDYSNHFSDFTAGEKVMVMSRSNQIYNGIFQFDSVINNNYCYIKFDSRQHIMRWEKTLVEHIDFAESSNRRVTRQMSKRQRTTSNLNEQVTRNAPSDVEEVIVYSDDSTVSVNDSLVNDGSESSVESNSDDGLVTDNDNDGRGVARAANLQFMDDSEFEHAASYEVLLALSDNSQEKTNHFDRNWLTTQGFVTNCVHAHECYICLEKVNDNEVVYNIKCDGVFKHPMHTKCAKDYIDKKGTTCPGCRGVWE